MHQYRCDQCGQRVNSNIELKGKRGVCNKLFKERQKGGRLRTIPCRGRLLPLKGKDLEDADAARESKHERIKSQKAEARSHARAIKAKAAQVSKVQKGD